MLNNVLLVNLSISCPSGVRKDKAASATVYNKYNCDAKSGQFSKRVWGDSLDDIKTLQSSIRSFHEKQTQPWMDSGYRIITSRKAIGYFRQMSEFEIQLKTLIDEFCQKVEGYKQNLKSHLGDLYNEADYVQEEDLRKLIGMQVKTMQVPGGDYRTELSNEEITLIEDRVKNSMEEALQNAMKTAKERVKNAIKRISVGCSEAGRISRNMVETLMEVIDSLSGFNLTDDPEFTIILEKARRDLTYHSSEDLMRDGALCEEIKQRADAIIDKLRGW